MGHNFEDVIQTNPILREAVTCKPTIRKILLLFYDKYARHFNKEISFQREKKEISFIPE